MINHNNKYELIKFEDGEFSLNVNVSPSEETVWLNAQEISLLFDRSYKTILKHIKNIFSEKELLEESNSQKMRLAGADKPITIYNLDVIISVGYRVKSKRGVQFRKWAISVLKQYLLIGYSINEKRCLECQDNLISLNNKVNKIIKNADNLEKRVDNLESLDNVFLDKLFFEDKIFEAYSFIKKIILSAQKEIIIIDGYIDLSVLDMLNEINIPIIIYTLPSATISKKDISTFQINHNLTVYRTTKVHDRFLLIDDDIYFIGSSLKDIGKKRFIMNKLVSIKKDELLLNL